MSLVDLLLRPILAPLGLASLAATTVSARGWWFKLKNLVLLLLALPSLHSLLRFLWSAGKGVRKGQAGFMLLMLAPLNLMPLILADLAAVQLLAAIALAGVCFEAYAIHVINRHGMRLI